MGNILQENQCVGKYRVLNLIKGGYFNETYRVVDDNDDSFFMKIYVMKRMPEKLIDESESEVREIVNCRNISHENIISYVDSGSVSLEIGECHYLVTTYFSGELIAEKVAGETHVPIEEAVKIIKGVLNGLRYMHGKCPPVMHNDITPRNIMMSQRPGGCPEIIDMGHISHRMFGAPAFETADLDVQYCANETFAGMYSEQSDIFSAIAVFYTMIMGHAPWHVDIAPDALRKDKIAKVKNARKSELEFGDMEIDPVYKEIISKGLAIKPSQRYESVIEVLRDLETHTVRRPTADSKNASALSREKSGSEEEAGKGFDVKCGGGRGFADIAGMNDLKEMLRQKVICVMTDKERAQRYRLTPPNGMLLYGPPGCGKTYFAEKFAEETKFNFILVKASDVASVYIHGTQGKIAELFEAAEANSPTVLCFDEFDALVPNRSFVGSQHLSGEVNEFLSQLNNCSQRGIFVVATSNRPDKIDPAVLRRGRIDKQVYVPLPDAECRREMFMHHLDGRPFDKEEIQIDELVRQSEGYVASDIAYVVDDAARIAAYNDVPITSEILFSVVRCTKPSIGKELLKEYEELRDCMNGIERRNTLPRVGFRTE